MTREEEIKQFALKRNSEGDFNSNDGYQGIIEGAQWADEHQKRIETKLNFDGLSFDVNTPGFLKEACESCNGGIYAKCWNIFRKLLAQTAERATELHDPILDILMLKLGLYEISYKERPEMINRIWNEWKLQEK